MNHHHSPNEFLRQWLRAAELSKHTELKETQNMEKMNKWVTLFQNDFFPGEEKGEYILGEIMSICYHIFFLVKKYEQVLFWRKCIYFPYSPSIICMDVWGKRFVQSYQTD